MFTHKYCRIDVQIIRLPTQHFKSHCRRQMHIIIVSTLSATHVRVRARVRACARVCVCACVFVCLSLLLRTGEDEAYAAPNASHAVLAGGAQRQPPCRDIVCWPVSATCVRHGSTRDSTRQRSLYLHLNTSWGNSNNIRTRW